MAQLNPYLSFDGNCREAMNFYKDCFGGELHLQTVEELPEMAARMPAEMAGHILHSSLSSGGIVIMASDLNREIPAEGNTISLLLNCQSEEELNTLFSKLSKDGKVIEPIGDMPWGARYGELKDKYGKLWALNLQKTPEGM